LGVPLVDPPKKFTTTSPTEAIEPLPEANSNADIQGRITPTSDNRGPSGILPQPRFRGDKKHVRESINEAIQELKTKDQPLPSQESGTTDHLLSSDKSSGFKWPNLVVVAVFECIAVPICIAAGEAFVSEHYGRAIFGWLIGLPLAAAGFTAPWWKEWISESVRASLIRQALRWGPVAILAAFIYVAGPSIYRRAVEPNAPTVNPVNVPSAVDANRAVTQEYLDAITSERDAAILRATALQRQLDEANAQSGSGTKLQSAGQETPQAWVTLGEFERVKRKKNLDLLPFSPDDFYEMHDRSASTDLFKDDWIKISNTFKSKDRENVREGFFRVIVVSDKGEPRLYFRDNDWETIQKYSDGQKLTAYCQFKGFTKDKAKNDQILAYCELP
jgi:hypothetical protein